MPVFDLIERMMIRRLNFAPGLALRLVARTAYVGGRHVKTQLIHAITAKHFSV